MADSLRLFAGRHSRALVRVGVVGGLWAVLIPLGYLTTRPELDPLLILATLVVPIGVFAVLGRIELGLMALLLSGVFVRFRLPTGTASEIVMSLVVCVGVLGVWVARMLAVGKRLALKPTPTNLPLLAFVVTVFASLGWSRAFRDVFVQEAGSPFVSVAAAVVMALLPITLLMVTNLVRDVRWLRALVWLFLAEGFVSLTITLISDLGIGPTSLLHQLIFRNGFVWVNTKGLFSMWYLSLSLALALFNRQLHWGWRSVLLIHAAGWAYWGFSLQTGWLWAWVPAFVAAVVVAFVRSKWLFLVLVVVLVLGAGGYYWRTEFQRESEQSGQTRLAAYKVNWRITGTHLFFGTGPAGYASYYMSYFPTEGMATHSNYIDIIAQTGIVGSFFLLWFFGAQVWGSYTLWRKLRGCWDFAESLSAAVLAGTVGCLVAMALGDWLLPFAYTQGIIGFDAAMFNWFLMGTVWALQHNLVTGSTRDNRAPSGRRKTE